MSKWVVVRTPRGVPGAYEVLGSPLDTATDAAHVIEVECLGSDLEFETSQFLFGIRRGASPTEILTREQKAVALTHLAHEIAGSRSPSVTKTLALLEDPKAERFALIDAGMGLEELAPKIGGLAGMATAATAHACYLCSRTPEEKTSIKQGAYKSLLECVEAMAKCYAWSWQDRPGATKEGELARARVFFQIIRSIDR